MKKTVLITGAAKGIGKATALEFAKNGYNIVITYNESSDEAHLLEDYIKEKYQIDLLLVKCDVTSEEEIKNLIDKVINKYKKIDVLINNAAYAFDNYIDDKTKEEFMKVLEVNLVGPFLMTKYAYKYMEDGTIINISSTDGDNTYNDISIDYCSSKAGLNMLTKTLAMALPSVRVVGIMPNWTETEAILEMNKDFLDSELKRIGQKRLQKPEEVAEEIYKVAESKIASGEIIRIDGDVLC